MRWCVLLAGLLVGLVVGLRTYIDPLPFWERAPTWEEAIEGLGAREPRLAGRTCVVTGASVGGIGFEVARALAGMGCRVVVGARTAEKGAETCAALQNARAVEAEFRVLDLASLASVRAFARTFPLSQGIDILVLNAGVLTTDGFHSTADGIELTLGVNLLAHFLLVELLRPHQLEQRGRPQPTRVVIVSSHGHALFATNVNKLDVNRHLAWTRDDFESRPIPLLAGMELYGNVKTAEILWARELARRGRARGIHTYAVHPGFVATNLGKERPAESATPLERFRAAFLGQAQALFFKSMPGIKNIQQGAAPIVHCAVHPALDAESGHYYRELMRVNSSIAAQDDEVAGRLWDWLEAFVDDRAL